MNDSVLEQIQAIIQRDVNNRGLATDPTENLLTVCQHDFAGACRTLAWSPPRTAVILTGFYIPAADAAETDGPLGAFFLARVLARSGWHVVLAAEHYCSKSLEVAYQCLDAIQQHTLTLYRLRPLEELPAEDHHRAGRELAHPSAELGIRFDISHLIAIERAGPSHTHELIPPQHRDHYHTMTGHKITNKMYPAHRWFEDSFRSVKTIGIGDGGNEIGMGKIPWEVIARNVPNGGLVACRVPTDRNIVCGVSNWGAYGLAAGIWHLQGRPFDADLFSADAEHTLWERVLQEAVLVDGVTGQRTLTVDGLSWDEYIQPLREIGELLRKAGKAGPT